jgi:hypothetical protein
VGAAADAGIVEMVLRLEKGQSEVLSQSGAAPRVALLGATGPICVDRPGSFRTNLTVTRGLGRVALRVWQAAPIR